MRLAVLTATDEPTGTDGYYYVVQVVDLATTGSPHVADASWVLRWLAVPNLLGIAPILAVKIAAAGLVAAAVPVAWLLGRRLAPGGGTALALWAAASPTLTHLAADFPKNLGLVPVLWAAFALASGRRWGWLVLAVAATATAHRVGAAVIGLAALGAGIGLGVRRIPPRGVAAVGVGIAAFLGIALFTPGLIHPGDLERVSGQLRSSPWPPPPWSWLPLRHTPVLQVIELGVLPWIALAVGIAHLRRPEGRAMTLAWLVPLAVCLWPGWRADTLDLGYRLGLVAPILAAPLLVWAWPFRRPSPWFGVLALPAGLWGFDPSSTPPYDRYRDLIAAIPRPLPALLIAPQGINFLYDHVTGHEAMAWGPEPHLDRRGIGRLAFGFRDGEWAAWAPADPPPVRLDASVVYVREDVWEAFVARARAEGDDEVRDRLDDPRNPQRIRPSALVRGRATPATADR